MAGHRNDYRNKVGRDAATGQFIPVREARRRKNEAVVETVPKRYRRRSE